MLFYECFDGRDYTIAYLLFCCKRKPGNVNVIRQRNIQGGRDPFIAFQHRFDTREDVTASVDTPLHHIHRNGRTRIDEQTIVMAQTEGFSVHPHCLIFIGETNEGRNILPA